MLLGPLPLGGIPHPLGATGFGKETLAEHPASSLLAGLAILNQFFLSSWEHSPELPSCHSLPGQLKAALFWERELLPPPPLEILLPRDTAHLCGTRPSQFGGNVPHPPLYFSLEMFLVSLRILSLIAQSRLGVEAQWV